MPESESTSPGFAAMSKVLLGRVDGNSDRVLLIVGLDP
jgi:hypothetical protein